VRPSDTAARLGGDEFAVLLEEATAGSPEAVADRILDAIAHPIEVHGKQLIVRASLGIARPQGRDVTAQELLRNADVAMYWAKGNGKGRLAVFEPPMGTAAVTRLEMREQLEGAVERTEFSLRYQPLVSLLDGRLQGAEALVRWEHPLRGTLAPADFIALAEDIGTIVPLGTWVIREACRQAREWSDAHRSAHDFRMSVNVSPRQLEDDGLVPVVAEALAESGIEPSRLMLEVTESVLMRDPDAALIVLHRLKALGVRIAIDDFGTGYSSLSHLHRFPIDSLKIDRTFVAGLRAGTDESALVRSIIKLGDTLRLETIAEGIEHPAELARLRRLGARVGQGFLFAPPLRPVELATMLDDPDARLVGAEQHPVVGLEGAAQPGTVPARASP
jgi:predicted signal transduction protein with EAL and GGDEF domain